MLLGADQLHNWPQNLSILLLVMSIYICVCFFIFINEFSFTKNVLYTLVDLIILVLTKKNPEQSLPGLLHWKNLGKHFLFENIFVNLVAPIFDIICMQDAAQFCRQAG